MRQNYGSVWQKRPLQSLDYPQNNGLRIPCSWMVKHCNKSRENEHFCYIYIMNFMVFPSLGKYLHKKYYYDAANNILNTKIPPSLLANTLLWAESFKSELRNK